MLSKNLDEFPEVGTPLRTVSGLYDQASRSASSLRSAIQAGKVLAYFAAQPTCALAMEACAGANYWERGVCRAASMGIHDFEARVGRMPCNQAQAASRPGSFRRELIKAPALCRNARKLFENGFSNDRKGMNPVDQESLPD